MQVYLEKQDYNAVVIKMRSSYDHKHIVSILEKNTLYKDVFNVYGVKDFPLLMSQSEYHTWTQYFTVKHKVL